MEYAVCGNNQALLEYLKRDKISDKKSVLLQAAAHCNVEVLKELKRQGCDFSIKDEGRKNLLHIAVKYNHAEVVSYLLKEGINPNDVTDFYENDALTIAVIEADKEKVEMLMESGMDWQKGDAFGRDTWIAVCEGGTDTSVELMLEKGFYPTDEEIIYGYENCNDSTFQALLDAKIPYDKEYVEDDYVLTGFLGLCYFHPELAERIYDMDSDVEVTAEILEAVIDNGYSELAKKMIKNAKSLDISFTSSPLETAVFRGNKELVQYLVEKGADINYIIPGEDGEYHTAIHTAASSPSTEILRYLIEHGGDITVTNYESMTPYEIAKKSKCYENMELLKEYF